jgi:membrane protein
MTAPTAYRNKAETRWRRALRARKRLSARARADNLGLIAAGIAFYAMLAIFPAIIGVVSVYALVADPTRIQNQLAPLTRALPPGGGDLVINQLTGAANAGHDGLTAGLIISILGLVFAASAGVRSLMTGLNVVFSRSETRGFIKLRLMSIGLTLGALAVAVIVLGLVAAFPVVLRNIGLKPAASVLAEVVRWVVLLAVVAIALGWLYRYAPAGRETGTRTFTPGIATAMAIWLVGSIGFSVYVQNFGSYNKTYGALAAVIVLLLWLYLSAYAVLFGAQIDAEREQFMIDEETMGPDA